MADNTGLSFRATLPLFCQHFWPLSPLTQRWSLTLWLSFLMSTGRYLVAAVRLFFFVFHSGCWYCALPWCFRVHLGCGEWRTAQTCYRCFLMACPCESRLISLFSPNDAASSQFQLVLAGQLLSAMHSDMSHCNRAATVSPPRCCSGVIFSAVAWRVSAPYTLVLLVSPAAESFGQGFTAEKCILNYAPAVFPPRQRWNSSWLWWQSKTPLPCLSWCHSWCDALLG